MYRLAFGIVPLVFALFLACEALEMQRGTMQGRLGEACLDDGGCDAPLLCVEGVCVAQERDDLQGKLGGSCHPNYTCDFQLFCVAGECSEPPATMGGLNQPCYEDYTCDGSLFCREGSCIAEGEAGALGGECLEDEECEGSNVCLEGVCECAVAGGLCSDGTIYAGAFGGRDYFTTPADLGWLFTWNDGSNSVTNTGADDEDDGWVNTASLASLDDAGAPYQAATACWELEAHGHSDWFLPSRNELFEVLHANAREIGAFVSGGPYWSSSADADDPARVWFLTFDYDRMLSTGPAFQARVRCLRAD